LLVELVDVSKEVVVAVEEVVQCPLCPL